MKNRIISILLITTIISSLVVGCGKNTSGDINKMSKSQLIEAYNNLQSNYEELGDELDSTKNSLAALTEDGTVNPAITTMGDGSGRFTFNSTDSKIIFPTSFIYPNSKAMEPNGKINIVNDVSITPSSTWITRINGSALELEQSNNRISGTIKVNEIDELITVDELQEDVLQPWFNNINYPSVKYTDIFVNSTSFGKQAETPIMIDSENAYLMCGMVGYGLYSITYVFVYKGEQDMTKDELIKNLLNTVQIDGNTLVIQN